jgi:Transposase DDE domain
MYLRTTQRRNSDGSTVRYVQLAHNHRVDGVTQAEVLVNFGREDAVDVAGLRRLVVSINRYLGEQPADVAEAAGAPLSVVESRSCGTVWLLDGLWKMLGIDKALGEVLDGRRFRTMVERVLFALVANRAVAPASKLAACDWVSHDAAVPALSRMDADQAYRAMDLLIDADAAAHAKVQETVFFAVANLLNLEVDVLFFDTTSTYFELDDEDDPDGATVSTLRRFANSKDHRPDLPQVVVGLAVTRQGIPVRCWVWPGNTTDATVIPQVKDDLRGWRLGRVITVVDRGFSSDANLAYLARAGGGWIAGERMRDGSPDAQAALARQGRYQVVRDNLRVKEVTVDTTPGKRWIICHNPVEADRDRQSRDQRLARIEAELERIAAARTKASAKAAKVGKIADDQPHRRAECALREHPTLGRYLRQQATGRLVVHRAKVADEAKLDGKYLLSTNDPHISAEDVALGYKNLLEAERSFRDMKQVIELRPVYHRLDQRIAAHILLCWLALLLVRVAERRTGQTWHHINTQLSRVHQVLLQGPDGQVLQTTPLNETQQALFTAVAVPKPPRITAIHPA